jgi:hypothetical protein
LVGLGLLIYTLFQLQGFSFSANSKGLGINDAFYSSGIASMNDEPPEMLDVCGLCEKPLAERPGIRQYLLQ